MSKSCNQSRKNYKTTCFTHESEVGIAKGGRSGMRNYCDGGDADNGKKHICGYRCYGKIDKGKWRGWKWFEGVEIMHVSLFLRAYKY